MLAYLDQQEMSFINQNRKSLVGRPSWSSPSCPPFPSFPMQAIISNAAATLIVLSPVHAVVPNATAKLTITLSLSHAVVPNATARPTATPSEEDGELDGDNDSVNFVAI
jgi:hypothetical protein